MKVNGSNNIASAIRSLTVTLIGITIIPQLWVSVERMNENKSADLHVMAENIGSATRAYKAIKALDDETTNNSTYAESSTRPNSTLSKEQDVAATLDKYRKVLRSGVLTTSLEYQEASDDYQRAFARID